MARPTVFLLLVIAFGFVLFSCKSVEIESIDFELSFEDSFPLDQVVYLDDVEITITYDDGSTEVIPFGNENIDKESGITATTSSQYRYQLDTTGVGEKQFQFSYSGVEYKFTYYVFDASSDITEPPEERN